MMAAGDDQPGAVTVPVTVRGQAFLRFHPSSSSTNAVSSSSSSARPIFLVFCKRRVVTTDDEDSGTPVPVQLAVVVCGPQGIVLRGHRPLLGFVGEHDDDDGDDEGQVLLLEAMALVEGLHTAVRLRIARVKAITDHRLLHNYMLGLSRPIGQKLAEMINQALSLHKQFEQCEISLVTDGLVANVVKPAKEGLDDEIAKYLATKEKTENCNICFEDIDTSKFHAVEGCAHRFCLFCMKSHMEVLLLGGMVPGCPQLGCTTKLTVEGSKALLSSRLLEIMALRLNEEDRHIHPSQRIYCPYPNCSALMSLSEVQRSFCSEYPATFRECVECGEPMCVDCKVAWHERMSCIEYQKRYPHGDPEGKRLHKLARRKMWKRCERCNHMIELAVGCSHIICVCGNQLCYSCGKTLAEDGSCACTGLAGRRRRRRCFQVSTCWGGMCAHIDEGATVTLSFTDLAAATVVGVREEANSNGSSTSLKTPANLIGVDATSRRRCAREQDAVREVWLPREGRTSCASGSSDPEATVRQAEHAEEDTGQAASPSARIPDGPVHVHAALSEPSRREGGVARTSTRGGKRN